MNLRFKMKNTGPIKDVDVALGEKITLFYGKNNSGKTYLSYILYGFLKSWRGNFKLKEEESLIEKLRNTGTLEINVSEIIKSLPDSLKRISATYKDIFPSYVFNSENNDFSETELQVVLDRELPKGMKIEIDAELSLGDRRFIINKVADEDVLTINIIPENENAEQEPLNRRGVIFIFRRVMNLILDEIFKDFKKPFILTAERSGITLFYKELDVNKNVLLERIFKTKKTDLDLFDLLDESLNRYSKPVKDNIDFIRDTDTFRKKKSFLVADENRDFLKALESFMDGNFDFDNDTFVFKSRGRGKNRYVIPLHLGSSFLKSMMSLYLYCFHLAEHGDVLIIDEPELNLHPEKQAELIRILCWLSNLGVSVVLTTHSDYILTEISNIVSVAKKGKDLYRNVGYRKCELVNSEEIKVFEISEGKTSEILYQEGVGMIIPSIDKTIERQRRISDTIQFEM